MPFSLFHFTHHAVAAGSRQLQAADACALDQSHSALSGDVPSASLSRPLFGNLAAAWTRSIPVEANEDHNV